MTQALLIAGAGGVGKTTVAAALAVTAARNGLESLVLTVDPARRLADAMDVSLGNEPEATPEPRLAAAMLDASDAWHQVVERHAPPDVAERLYASPFFQAIAERFPAGQSYAAAEEMAEYLEAQRWDLVVVDTPPSGGGLDFFSAPSQIRKLVGGRVLRWLTGARLPGRRRLYTFTARPALRLADAVLGGPLLEEVAEFLLDLRVLYDGISRRARQLERHLKRARTVVVTTADPAPMSEAARFFGQLPDSLGKPRAVLFNRSLPAAWAGARDDSVAPPFAENLERWGSEALRQVHAQEAFAARHGTELASLPWTLRPPTGLDDLAGLIAEARSLDLAGIGVTR
jgi:anion-transporting  ArsA/GET3 family ATPase